MFAEDLVGVGVIDGTLSTAHSAGGGKHSVYQVEDLTREKVVRYHA